MRAKRSKQYRKVMSAYTQTFSFREPYQVLLTTDLLRAAAQHKMRLGSMLATTLHATKEIKPMITQCSIRHLYALPNTDAEKEGLIATAKNAERRRCNHHELDEPLSESECLEACVGKANKFKYCIASQDVEVRRVMRNIPGVPIIYVKRSVMVLEPMSQPSVGFREGVERGKVRAGLVGGRGVKRQREDDDQSGDDRRAAAIPEPVRKKARARGPKEPNPLAVKKSKKIRASGANEVEIEGERAALRQAAKTDPQTEEKAAPLGDADRIVEGARKRKRKRKGGDAAPTPTPPAPTAITAGDGAD